MSLTPEDVVAEEIREAFPSHLLLKIDSVSLLLNGNEKHESREFAAGGYEWRLIIHPNGKEDGERGDHVSVNLAVADTGSLPENWEITAFFNVLLYNQILDNYRSIQGHVRRFHSMKPEWGISRCISKKILKDPTNGYVVDDNCVLGAEVFVLKNERVVHHASMLEAKKPYVHYLTISDFSKLVDDWFSEDFRAWKHKWKVRILPKGVDNEKGRSISIYLKSVDCESYGFDQKMNVDYSICIKNQLNDNMHKSKAGSNWFSTTSPFWGWTCFLPLADVEDPKKGFVVDDCCIIEVEISKPTTV